MAITPRHYLDFIHHFVKLYNEKRSDLEEQQLHLNVGLSKIAETVEQVEEMQKSLAVKSQVCKNGYFSCEKQECNRFYFCHLRSCKRKMKLLMPSCVKW